MNFYTWMMEKHLRTDAPIGDLARDMRSDLEFPYDGDKEEIAEYLEDCGACDACMDTFEEAWERYEREMGGAKTDRGCESKRRDLPEMGQPRL